MKCEHGIHGIFKIKQIPFPWEEPTALIEDSRRPVLAGIPLSDANAELAAYAMDALLELNVVPITVKRKIRRVGIGSVQYFMKNVTGIEEDTMIFGFRKMKILDYIIHNCDRHTKNWLYLSSSKRIVAIDQGRSFRDEEHPPVPPPSISTILIYLTQEPALCKRLQQITDQEIKRTLAPYLRNFSIRKVIERIHTLQIELNKHAHI